MASLKIPHFLLFALIVATSTSAGTIGINYGRVANNLPNPSTVVSLLKSHGISRVKLYDADPTVLRALSGTGIRTTITVPNELLISTATKPSFASAWVSRNVASHYPDTLIDVVSVGNEVFVDPHNLSNYLVPAMSNIHQALVDHRLDSAVKVSSPIALSALQSSYPPSSGSFKPDLAGSVIKPMLEFLRRTGSFLMVNAYPFFAYEANSDVISLDYALFRPNPGVLDPGNGLRYYSLLDAQIDAVFAAMSALKYDDLRLVVTETGWPSKGDPKETGASVDNAAAYNGNLARRVLVSDLNTPRKPQADIDVYLFALFNENQKFGPTSERNYGLFYPNEEAVYEIAFTADGATPRRKEVPQVKAVAPAAAGGGGGGGGVTTSSVGRTWCVANGRAAREKLQQALDYACGEGKADCRAIQPGQACYDPNTIEAHASFAFNSYYQRNGRGVGTCDFEGAAYVVTQAPKFGECELPTGA
ncbi:Glucan endo-1,3-beta-glucosidase 12 [Acorus calamus]|uniref:glucan endo-1,3-beta-D-glucosidase n=1 Tax=Acorus calamus TaxID=4465 RepID=A0AAV9D639_ACOCL|nr:Glucan endo-1,3-beta-glucosidase 12 [Acorus calamus]